MRVLNEADLRRTKHARCVALLGLAYVAWWAAMVAIPSIRPHFVGASLAGGDFLWLAALDVWVPVLSFVELRLLSRASSPFWLGTARFVLVGLGWVAAMVISLREPMAAYGSHAMLLACTVALGMDIARRRLPIVWGPFRFGKSEVKDARALTLQFARQASVLWAIFFGLLPTVFWWVERQFGWPQWQGAPILGAALVCAIGTIGLWGARAMAVDGEGTPLPIVGTRRLVISGPYAYIRNPMATAGIVQGLCVGLAFGSPLVVTYALCGAALWDLCARPLEEEYLLSEFGEEYERYREAVPCWRIRFSRYQPTESPKP